MKYEKIYLCICGFLYSKNMANIKAFLWKISSSINLFFLKSVEQNRCHTVPLVFSDQSSCNGGFNQKNCTQEERIMEIVYYYDWNSEKCHQSIMSLCSEDDIFLFQDIFNSFNSLTDCLEGKYRLKLLYSLINNLLLLLSKKLKRSKTYISSLHHQRHCTRISFSIVT